MNISNALRLLLATAAAVSPCLIKAQTVWTMASGYSESSFQTVNLKQFAQDVETSTGGKLKIVVHANNSMFKLAEIPKRVESGDIQIGETIMTNLSAEFPAAGADSVPFIVGSYEDAHRLWQVQRPIVDAELEEKGLVDLYAVAWPPQGLYSAKPIKYVGDLKGSKMRTYNSTTQRIAEQLGAKPVEVMMTDLSSALSSGRIESMITSGATGIDCHAWDYMKHFYDIHAWYPKNIVIVNRSSYDKLESNIKQALRSAAVAAELRGWKMSQAVEADSLVQLASHGMQMDPVDFEFRTKMRQYGERFSLEWVRSVGPLANAVLIPYYAAAPH